MPRTLGEGSRRPQAGRDDQSPEQTSESQLTGGGVILGGALPPLGSAHRSAAEVVEGQWFPVVTWGPQARSPRPEGL